MAFQYTLVFILETDATVDECGQSAIEYLMGASDTPPSLWPSAVHFEFEQSQQPFAESYRKRFAQAYDVNLTRLTNVDSGAFEGYSIVLQLPGIRLEHCAPVMGFIEWASAFSPCHGPVGVMYSSEMLDRPPTIFFVFERVLCFGEYKGAPKPFTNGKQLQNPPYAA